MKFTNAREKKMFFLINLEWFTRNMVSFRLTSWNLYNILIIYSETVLDFEVFWFYCFNYAVSLVKTLKLTCIFDRVFSKNINFLFKCKQSRDVRFRQKLN